MTMCLIWREIFGKNCQVSVSEGCKHLCRWELKSGSSADPEDIQSESLGHFGNVMRILKIGTVYLSLMLLVFWSKLIKIDEFNSSHMLMSTCKILWNLFEKQQWCRMKNCITIFRWHTLSIQHKVCSVVCIVVIHPFPHDLLVVNYSSRARN